ncbi:MAG: hypothetical protein J0I08_05670 [Rhizobiales bacterium]|nr:hypothetical protein [Hyphomicrobiales bacterium]
MAIVAPFKNLAFLEDQLTALTLDIRNLRVIGKPHLSDLEAAPILEGWALGELVAPCLLGAVIGHPLLGSRPHIHTSQLVVMDTDLGWARTWSRFYRLGERSGIPRRH